MTSVAISDMVLSVAASLGLYRKMRETLDIFDMSKEILTAGGVLMAALGELVIRLGSWGLV